MSNEESTIIQGYLKRMQDEYENFNTVYNDLLTKLNLAQTEYTKQDDQFKKLLTDETNLVTIYSSSTRQNFNTEFEKVQSAAQAKILNISQVPEELDEFIKLANLDLEGVRNQLNEISQNVSAIKDEANAQIDSINRELPKVTEAGQKAIEDMNKVVNQVTASGQTLQQQINELDLRLSGIVNNQSNISKDITAIQETNKAINASQEALLKLIDKTDDRIDQINQQIGDIVKIRTDIDTLKINKADKTFVTEQLAQTVHAYQFERLNDEPDDTGRLQRAINYAHENNRTLHLNGELYYVFMLSVPAGLTIIGEGATLKKPNLSAEPYNMTPIQMKWQRLMEIDDYSGNIDSPQTIIQGITFDGNCWSMWEEPSYDQEQASLLYAHADNTKPGRLNLKITHCHFMNNVSDGVHVRQNVNLQIDNTSSFDCFRGGLTITGGHTKVIGTNLQFRSDRLNDGIDLEVDGNGYGGSSKIELILDGVMIDRDLDISGGAGNEITINNLIMNESKGGFNFSIREGGSLKISNSKIVGKLSTTLGNRLYFGGKAHFYNCDFICNESPENINSNSENSVLLISNYYRSGSDFYDNTVIFDFCSFDYLYELNEGARLHGLRSPLNKTAKITVTNTRFSNKLSTGITGGWLKLYFDKNIVESFQSGVNVTGNDYTTGSHTIIGENDWGNIERGYLSVDGTGITIEHLGSHIDATKTNAFGNFLIDKKETTHASYFNYLLGTRILYVDVDPTTVSNIRGIVNDTAILKGTNTKWTCVKSGTGSNSWHPIT